MPHSFIFLKFVTCHSQMETFPSKPCFSYSAPSNPVNTRSNVTLVSLIKRSELQMTRLYILARKRCTKKSFSSFFHPYRPSILDLRSLTTRPHDQIEKLHFIFGRKCLQQLMFDLATKCISSPESTGREGMGGREKDGETPHRHRP